METIDESLIGRNINKIKKYDKKYFISFDNVAIAIFDHQGKFLRRIQKNGGGPSEYTRLNDFDVLLNGNILVLDNKKLLFYSDTGEFIKAIPLDIIGFNIKVINEDNFLICASGEKYSIYYDCQSCIDKGYLIVKILNSQNSNQKIFIISSTTNIGRDQARNNYYDFVYNDENGSLRKELKFIYTPVILVLDKDNRVLHINFPETNSNEYEIVEQINRIIHSESAP